MIVNFKLVTNDKDELYHNVGKISIKGNVIILQYVDIHSVEFLTRIQIDKIQWFNIVTEECK